MDLHENRDNNTMTAMFELPGMAKDNVHIHVQNDRLEVSGESKLSQEWDEGGFTVRERQTGRFYRSLPIPQGMSVCIAESSRFPMALMHILYRRRT